MSRSRRPTTRKIASGGVLAIGLVLPAVLVAFTPGCSTQEVAPSADAARPPCNQGPFLFSCAAPGDDVPSCSSDPPSNDLLTRLERGKRYPLGCIAQLIGARDEQGDCELQTVCKCEVRAAPGTLPPAADAGPTDAAGDAAPADAAPPPPPPDAGSATPGAVWNCF